MEKTRIVGVFWVCDDGKQMQIIYDTEEYSADYVSDFGDEFVIYEKQHNEVWSELSERFFDGNYKTFQYNDFPRGRVTFDSEEGVYIVDCDKKLKKALPVLKTELEKIFEFDEPVKYRAVPHLKSSKGIFNRK